MRKCTSLGIWNVQRLCFPIHPCPSEQARIRRNPRIKIAKGSYGYRLHFFPSRWFLFGAQNLLGDRIPRVWEGINPKTVKSETESRKNGISADVTFHFPQQSLSPFPSITMVRSLYSNVLELRGSTSDHPGTMFYLWQGYWRQMEWLSGAISEGYEWRVRGQFLFFSSLPSWPFLVTEMRWMNSN